MLNQLAACLQSEARIRAGQAMKIDSLGQTLEESLNNPESWIRQAEQQFLVAEAIPQNIRARASTEAELLLRIGYLKTTALLLALAIENSLKSVKASKNELKVDKKGLTKNSRGGGRSGHSLRNLADEAGLHLTDDQIILIEKLTEIGIWAGKYHAPIYHEAFEASNQKNPRSLTLPSDLLLTKQILLKSSELSGITSLLDQFQS